MLRNADPDPGSKRSCISDPDSHQRILVFFTQITVYKLSKIWSRMLIPDPGSGLFSIPDPGSGLFSIPDPGAKKAPDPGSGSITLDFQYIQLPRFLFAVQYGNVQECCTRYLNNVLWRNLISFK